MADEKKGIVFPSFMFEIQVRFYRENDCVQRKTRITEETLRDYPSGPDALAMDIFKEIFADIWKNREMKKGEEKKDVLL